MTTQAPSSPPPAAPEQVHVQRGARTDQTIIVSIDSTRLGPALGGCRIKTYPSWHEGLTDALRLSAAMTEKAALAGLDHGGGKTVVTLEEQEVERWTGQRRSDLLADVADAVEALGGQYITGPDVGSGPEDMGEIFQRTSHVLCRPTAAGGSGDSSGPTALGTIASVTAVCEHLWPGRDLDTLAFSVIGLGRVGGLVGAALADRGARLVVADVDPARRALAEEWGATWVEPDEALLADVDVVVPSAVGGIISSFAQELEGASAARADDLVRGIGDRLAAVLTTAAAAGTTPLHAARGLVQHRLHSAPRTSGAS